MGIYTIGLIVILAVSLYQSRSFGLFDALIVWMILNSLGIIA